MASERNDGVKMLVVLYYFFIYSFIGWILEVIYTLYMDKKLVNRGFLIGPICPIYGIGSLMITYGLGFINNEPFLLCICATILIAILEYLTSYLLEKIFKARWWDYSYKKYNLNGRICLDFILAFAILSWIVVYLINPFILSCFNFFKAPIYNIIGIILFIIFVTDVLVSFNIIFKFKNIIMESKTDNTEEISKKVRDVLTNYSLFYRRILKAFPHLKLKIVNITKKIPKLKLKI